MPHLHLSRPWSGAALGLAIAAMALPSAAAAAPGGKQPTSVRARAEAQDAFRVARRIKAGKGVRTGRELTPALAELARRLPALAPADRQAARKLLARPTQGVGDPKGDGYDRASVRTCDPRFCFHWVTGGRDAPNPADSNADGVPNYVELMASKFARVYQVENETLGWQPPPPDRGIGGDDRLDVYLKDLTPQHLYGYVSADPGQTTGSAFTYQVMDNDFVGYGTPPEPALESAAAHEYNHVVQYGYSRNAESWVDESTATWMEEVVYPEANDYLQYLESWAESTAEPLTDSGDDSKKYGSATWNHYLSRRYGPDVTRINYERSQAADDFSGASYDQAIRARGGRGFERDFVGFAASTAEWRTASAGYPDAAAYPDVERAARLATNAGVKRARLDHTAYLLLNVPIPSRDRAIGLDAVIPQRTGGGIALVGRTGGATTGTATTVAKYKPIGGSTSVTLPNPRSYERITAVLVNADTSASGRSSVGFDWNWQRDGQILSGQVITAPCRTATRSLSAANRALRAARKKLARATSASARRTYARQVSSLRRHAAKAKSRRSRDCRA